MNDLIQGQCEPCRVGAPQVTAQEAAEFQKEIPRWRIRHTDGVDCLVRSFEFKDFKSALAFTNRVGELAETQGHHPALLTEWGSVQVSWWTHKIGGLHKNDFIMAALTDQLYPG